MRAEHRLPSLQRVDVPTTLEEAENLLKQTVHSYSLAFSLLGSAGVQRTNAASAAAKNALGQAHAEIAALNKFVAKNRIEGTLQKDIADWDRAIHQLQPPQSQPASSSSTDPSNVRSR